MTQFLIQGPDPSKIHADFLPVLSEAKAIQVTDKPSADRAAELMQGIAGAIKFLKDGDPTNGWPGFTKPKKAADEAHDFICKAEKAALFPYEDAKKALGLRVFGWQERERLAAEEAARVAQEAARKAEEERKIREAVAAEEAGDKAGAVAILDEPVTAPTFTPAEPAKLKGVSIPMAYKGSCDDLLALAKHVIAHPEDVNLLQPNESAINARARSQKEAFKLPGCRLVKEPVVRTRTA